MLPTELEASNPILGNILHRQGADFRLGPSVLHWLRLRKTGAQISDLGHPESRDPKTDWDYGHPNTGVVTMLEGRIRESRPPVEGFVGDGAQLLPRREDHAIYATGWDGDVVVKGDAAGHIAVQLGAGAAQPLP